ncbi:MAG: hypothetical protein BWY76_01475 [bacterium ADurb.Bin429]|nr:MAG: hypothetical protein BWY76_01475 [bacterium ADurb.Bin429]
MLFGVERLQEDQRLHGFADAHVVRQAAAEAVVMQEMQPVEARLLIMSQLSAEGRRQRSHGDAGKSAQLLHTPGIFFVHPGVGIAQRQFQQHGLRFGQPYAGFRFLPHGEEVAIARDELFRQHPQRAVGELHVALACFNGLANRRQ